MRTRANIVQAIYNNAKWAQQIQSMGKPFIVVMTKTDHALHESARLDIKKIAWAAGVEMPKSVSITVRHGVFCQQETGLKELNKLLKDIREAKDCESVMAKTGIATGYANAMRHFDLISENELKDVIEVIGQAGEKTASRIKSANRPFWLQIFRKRMRA